MLQTELKLVFESISVNTADEIEENVEEHCRKWQKQCVFCDTALEKKKNTFGVENFLQL